MINEKEQRKKRNEEIRKAVLVSQMMETEGFKVFMEWLEKTIKDFKFQDIMGLKDEKTIITQQGYVIAYEDVEQFFKAQDILSQKPMLDEDTGEPEIMNEKKDN